MKSFKSYEYDYESLEEGYHSLIPFGYSEELLMIGTYARDPEKCIIIDSEGKVHVDQCVEDFVEIEKSS